MIRRTFIEILSGLLVPRPGWVSGDRPAAHPPAIESRIASWVDGTDPEWLTDWLRMPRPTLLPEDLPQIPDPDQRELAAQILRRMQSGAPFPFQYFGGSDFGTRRQVLPVMLFTTSDDNNAPWEFELGPIYLLAWCQSRDAPRTFRLDRMRAAALSPSKLADFPLS